MSVPLAQSVVLVLAAKRLTRLVTTDWIGEWTLVRPAKKWAFDREGEVDVHLPQSEWGGTLVDPSKGLWRSKLVSGLDCDWCVGVWAAALLALPVPRGVDRLRQPLVLMLAVAQGAGMISQYEHYLASKVEDSLVHLEEQS